MSTYESVDQDSGETLSDEQVREGWAWASAATRAVLANLGLPDKAAYAVLSYLARDAETGEAVRQVKPYPLTHQQVAAIIEFKRRAADLMQQIGVAHELGGTVRWQLIAKLAYPGSFGR